MTENDAAWERVFAALELPAALRAQRICYLTADALKKHGRREPRLMAKMDTIRDRPAVFREHAVNLFPVRNGKYALLHDPHNRTFFQFGQLLDQADPRPYYSRANLAGFDSFPADLQFSESQAIDFAFVSSLLRTFFGDPDAVLTLRGRLFSERFTFPPPPDDRHPAGEPVAVQQVQIEVDAGYEGRDCLFLLEAKVGRRDDFNIRQLYYPFLNWSVRSRKRIVPVFLTFTNGTYYLTEFTFGPAFGELSVVRNEAYTINDSPWALLDWPRLLSETPGEPEEAPFPQADDLDKVVDVVLRVAAGASGKAQLAQAFEFDERQGDYYANAARYLGLLKRAGHEFQLTESGLAFARCRARAERTAFLARRMLARPALREAITRLRERNWLLAALAEEELSQLIARHTGLNQTTARRRALTVRNWMTWLLKNSRPAGPP